jgi:hypothetical protein
VVCVRFGKLRRSDESLLLTIELAYLDLPYWNFWTAHHLSIGYFLDDEENELQNSVMVL